MLCRAGVTRIVLLVGPWAIKFPRFGYGWRKGLQGLLGNDQEAMFWRETRWVQLCPVVWSAPGGFVLVMRRARALDDIEWEDFQLNGWIIEPGFDLVEPKQDSFGVIGGRVVAVDYGS